MWTKVVVFSLGCCRCATMRQTSPSPPVHSASTGYMPTAIRRRLFRHTNFQRYIHTHHIHTRKQTHSYTDIHMCLHKDKHRHQLTPNIGHRRKKILIYLCVYIYILYICFVILYQFSKTLHMKTHF